MKKSFHLEGMTCSSCVEKVQTALSSVDGVDKVVVNLSNKEATLSMKSPISSNKLQSALPAKYTLTEKEPTSDTFFEQDTEIDSKWLQLRPLFIIIGYITSASFLLHIEVLKMQAIMFDFMGLFFLVFSFFKILDIRGFANTFRMYDPIASRFLLYGFVYPLIETALALMFLYRWNLTTALLVTIGVLGATTIGVVRVLIDKRPIKCACLGTALDLPMTEATFIENALMLIMAVILLLG